MTDQPIGGEWDNSKEQGLAAGALSPLPSSNFCQNVCNAGYVSNFKQIV